MPAAATIATAFISCPSCNCNLTCRQSSANITVVSASDPTGILSLETAMPVSTTTSSAVNGYCTVIETTAATSRQFQSAANNNIIFPEAPAENSLDIESLLVQRQSY